MTAAVLFFAALATTPVQALGQAPIVAGNRVSARDRALDEALKQAVDQALTYVLDPDSRLRAQAVLRRDLLPRARTYVPSYRVLDEHEAPGNLFQVQIEAQVDTTALRRDAVAVAGVGGGPPVRGQPPATPPPAPGRPRVLVATGAPAAEAVRRALEGRAFAAFAAQVGEQPRSDIEAGALARGAGAGIVVVGSPQLTAEGRVRGTDLVAAQARLELRAVDGDGRALARGAADGRGFDATLAVAQAQAVENAATPAAERLADELAARYAAPKAGDAADGGGVLVRAVGLSSWKDVDALEQSLAQLPGVSGVVPRRLGAGEAWMLVKTSQAGGAVAAALRSQGLQIDGSSDREVRIRLARSTP